MPHRYQPPAPNMSITRFIGFQSRTSQREQLISTLGAILAIVSTGWASWYYTGEQGALALLPSMGASAVLLFAVPHGALSQPWALFGGHLFSAAIGVTCAQIIPSTWLAAACAVGLSIGCMQLYRCVHPPGGATALVAVIGGPAIQHLGYHYLLVPTLLNCTIIFMMAFIFNNFFSWRRYPASFMHYATVYAPDTRQITIDHITQAMATLDEVIDIEPEQIKYLIDKADEIMRNPPQEKKN